MERRSSGPKGDPTGDGSGAGPGEGSRTQTVPEQRISRPPFLVALVDHGCCFFSNAPPPHPLLRLTLG